MTQKKISTPFTDEQRLVQNLQTSATIFTWDFKYKKFLEDFLFLSRICVDNGLDLPESFIKNCDAIQSIYKSCKDFNKNELLRNSSESLRNAPSM